MDVMSLRIYDRQDYNAGAAIRSQKIRVYAHLQKVWLNAGAHEDTHLDVTSILKVG